MERIRIDIPGVKSEILIGESWENVRKLLPAGGVVIITDHNVKALYGDRFPEVPVFSVDPGEGSKRLSVIESLAEKLMEAGIDRSGFILAVGGGVVSDVAGFLASVYMRGIRCGYVSTTLLSQVDASTGGKTGVNLGETKNMLGIIRQPEFVICDPGMLLTLSEDEYLSGLSELIKTAIIGSLPLFELIEQRRTDILKRDSILLSQLVAESVKFKAGIVSEDEREKGKRRILNFGHTYGHAFELQKKLKHGFAVASGMVLATEFSFEKKFISASEKQRVLNVLNEYNLTGKIDVPADQLERLIVHDKKKSGNDINFIFIKGIGQAEVQKIPVRDILDFYKRFRD